MKADHVIIRGNNLESDVKSRYENMNEIDILFLDMMIVLARLSIKYLH